ncbi:hypothetical protein SLE2022_038870 [Rubroshorea leprosula]
MSDEPEQRNWLELPRDVTASIFSRLGAIDILKSVQNVCSLWRNICKDPSMWRSIDMRNPGDLYDMDHVLEQMCMHAVDRSNGDLVDINIEYFGSDELLAYIADRSSGLRRLRIACCSCISDEGLREAASKLTLLEELEITYCCPYISADALEVVGRCCPRLKSFKFNKKVYMRPHIESDEDAQVIAQNMHELRHLQLLGNKLTNCGLQAILDGCPHLQSLDLRQCFNVILRGDLEKRCTERIKHLWRPQDSTEGFEYDTTSYDFGSPYEDYPSGPSDISLMSDDDYDYELEFSDDYPYDYDDFFEEYYFDQI